MKAPCAKYLFFYILSKMGDWLVLRGGVEQGRGGFGRALMPPENAGFGRRMGEGKHPASC
ncbi:hypothetical protein [Tannerella forsythia]|uniref:hypothetical protein n=1 Tax=Tannerella forsythia TaxID=28112 RepID=UPI0011CF3217|nr:hypothetical protein [Tannerella forsythia]